MWLPSQKDCLFESWKLIGSKLPPKACQSEMNEYPQLKGKQVPPPPTNLRLFVELSCAVWWQLWANHSVKMFESENRRPTGPKPPPKSAPMRFIEFHLSFHDKLFCLRLEFFFSSRLKLERMHISASVKRWAIIGCKRKNLSVLQKTVVSYWQKHIISLVSSR